MTSERYRHITSPVRLGPVELPNRFYFSPHGLSYNVGAAPSDVFSHYYGARAEGGCGLLIHAMAVLPRRGGLGITPYLESAVPSFAAAADFVHDRGAKLFAEIHYSRVGNGWRYEPGSPVAPLFGPSSVQIADGFHVTHEMSEATIWKLIEAHGISSRNLARAGYDGIELHCSHAMLCEGFLSPYMNHRTDDWGGSVENRMRFLVECLKAAREGAGPELAIGMRYNADELVHAEGGLSQEETKEILARLVDMRLLDFVDIDVALEPDQLYIGMPSYHLPKQLYRPYVENLRSVTGDLPVLSALGRITTIAEADEAIAAGVCDLVGATRQLMTDPDTFRQAIEGREDETRTCLACNICTGAPPRDMWGCAINPETGREARWRRYEPAPSACRVVVVGGGPAGLEAARVAAKRGHTVLLLEKRGRVGGQMNLWAELPGCEIFATTPAWWERQLANLGVEVRTGVEASEESILAEQPDAVIIATGSRYVESGDSGYRKAPIEGWGSEIVLTPEMVIEDKMRPQGRVLVLDEEGITTGAGIAELLALQGADVTLLSSWLGMLAHMSVQLSTTTLQRLKAARVKLAPLTYIRRIEGDQVTTFDIHSDEETRITGVGAVVLATSRRPVDRLAYILEGKAPQVLAAGDALAPRGLSEAVHEGHRFARLVGVDDAPRNFTDVFFAPLDYSVFQRPAAALAQDGATSK